MLLTVSVCLNLPQLATAVSLQCIWCKCLLYKLLSVDAAVTHPPRFFHDFPDFFLAAHTEQRQQPACGALWRATWEDVLDNHLFRCFFLSHRRFKGGTLWENKLRTAFPLRQLHNSLPVSGRASQRTPWLARKISLHLLTNTKNGIGWLPEVTHALTFTVYSVWLLRRLNKQVRLY